jgi:hypothetical protein
MKKQWTAQDIYLPSNRASPYVPPMYSDVPQHPGRYTPEFLTACKTETDWHRDPVATIVTRDPAFLEAIGRKQTYCPACNDVGSCKDTMRGGVTGLVINMGRSTCECAKLQTFWRHWSKVAIEWQGVTLEGLQPNAEKSDMDMGRQATVIAAIKAEPDSSYLFYGESGAGKTLYSMALFRKALEDWAATGMPDCPIWYYSATALLAQAHEHVMDVEQPALNINRYIISKRRDEGQVPKLFLSEIDKADLTTPFRRKTIFELVDAIKEAGGATIMTSNLGPAALAQVWGEQYGEPMLRRFSAAPFGQRFNFSSEPSTTHQ